MSMFPDMGQFTGEVAKLRQAITTNTQVQQQVATALNDLRIVVIPTLFAKLEALSHEIRAQRKDEGTTR